jgi:hypothetical protein
MARNLQENDHSSFNLFKTSIEYCGFGQNIGISVVAMKQKYLHLNFFSKVAQHQEFKTTE